MDECKFYELDGKFYLFRFIPMLIVGIFSYIYSLVKKMEKPSHFYMGFTIVIFAIIGMIQMPLERYRIKLRPSIVTKAVVIDKPANYAGLYAEVVYYVKTYRFRSTISIGRKDYNQLELNDTILLKYTADCEYLIDYYKLFPSKKN